MEYPAPLKHADIQELWPRVWRVRGSVRMGPGVVIPRNMVVVGTDDGLVVVSAVRLDERGEAALRELGEVKHVVRIGTHRMDDAYYVERFGAQHWAPDGLEPEGVQSRVLSGDTHPFGDAQIFLFRETTSAEAAICLNREQGILLTCDSLQHWPSLEGCSLMAKPVTVMLGFTKHPVVVGPPWRKGMTPSGGSLRSDFERLSQLPFDALVAGHGEPLMSGAKAEVQRTIELSFERSAQ